MTPSSWIQRERKWYQCTECKRTVRDWERTSHWQRHNPGGQCCPGHVARVGQVQATFVEVSGNGGPVKPESRIDTYRNASGMWVEDVR